MAVTRTLRFIDAGASEGPCKKDLRKSLQMFKLNEVDGQLMCGSQNALQGFNCYYLFVK